MKDKLVAFLRGNIIDRTLHTAPVEYALEGDELRGVYSDTMQFSGLEVSDTGVQFDMTTVTNEKIYGPDGGLRHDYVGTSVFRYRLAQRRSTGEVTGFMRCVSTTVREQTMDAVVYGVSGVRLEGGELRWSERQLMYRDSPSGDGKYKPVAFDFEIRFYSEGGKAVFEYVPTFWNIDPQSMEKTPAADQYPPFVSREK